MTNPRTPAVAPLGLRVVADQVEARLQRLLDGERERWSQVDVDLAAPVDTLAELVLEGGKRLRPAFCYWGFVGAGGDPDDERITDAGAAFELLQAFALVHDDVMDGSAPRRGRPAVHIDYADRHDRQGWRGEPRRFGEGVAVLIGDLAHVYADQFMAGAPAEGGSVWEQMWGALHN